MLAVKCEVTIAGFALASSPRRVCKQSTSPSSTITITLILCHADRYGPSFTIALTGSCAARC
jgi:hypothetical protein